MLFLAGLLAHALAGCDGKPSLAKTQGPPLALGSSNEPTDSVGQKLTAAEKKSMQDLLALEAPTAADATPLLARENKPQMQLVAISTLAKIPNGGGEPEMMLLLDDPETTYLVKVNILRVLVGRGDAQSIAAINAHYTKVDDRQKSDVLNLLGNFGGTDDMALLETVMREGQEPHAGQALVAKRQIEARVGR